MNRLTKYNNKRNFNKTDEPIGKITKSNKKKIFVVQHHISKIDHYDFRLEDNGVLVSFSIPKGPSYDIKRLAIKVENHPIEYKDFEGKIEDGEYGAGTVMIWDNGYYEKLKGNLNSKSFKFKLYGKRLKGIWSLIKFNDNYLLIKDNDGIKIYDDINEFNTSIKSNKTMEELKNNDIVITNKDKKIFKNNTKNDVINYYKKVYNKMSIFLKNRILSVVRCPNGISEEKFFKKHFKENKYLKKLKNKYYISNFNGLINEAQLNTIEFHISTNIINDNYPNIMIFDIDPDKNVSLDNTRKCVLDLKEILDKLNLKSYLKTSGKKGYHIFIPLDKKMTFKKAKEISSKITLLLTEKNDIYTTNIRLKNRKNKIFIDYFRNNKNASCVCPYSLRAYDNLTISMPIKWSDLYKIKPDDININNVEKYLKRKNPWKDFY